METIKFNDWEKLDFRVGQIKKVDDHPNADRLYVMEADIGGDKLVTLTVGLKEHYSKEELIDKKVIIFVNLEPKKLRGVESHGMVLAADDGKNIVLLSVDKDIGNGAKIR